MSPNCVHYERSNPQTTNQTPTQITLESLKTLMNTSVTSLEGYKAIHLGSFG